MSAASIIARRYLGSTKSSRFFSWMTALSISGISIGISAMIVVISVINGFETEFRSRFLAANAHIMAYRFPAIANQELNDLSKRMKENFGSEITGISPFVQAETVATKDGIMHNILIRGIDPSLRKSVQDAATLIRPKGALEQLTKGCGTSSLPDMPKPIILGTGLMSLLQIKVGETVKIITPATNSLIGSQKSFCIVGVYDSGLRHYDDKLGIMFIHDAQATFKLDEKAHGFEIGLKNPKNSGRVAEEMSEQFSTSRLTIKDWQSFNQQFFEMLETERAVIALIVALVAFVASFNILTTLFLMVTQKQRSISVLKAMGATNSQIQKTFILQGLYIGMIGALIGSVLACVISKFLERFKIVDLPDVYLLARLPVTWDWSVYATVAVAGCFICVIAGIYPAWVASRVTIVDGFRGK